MIMVSCPSVHPEWCVRVFVCSGGSCPVLWLLWLLLVWLDIV